MEGSVVPEELLPALNYLRDNLDTLLAAALEEAGYGNVSTDFRKLKLEERAEVYTKVLGRVFRFVKVPPAEFGREWEVYAVSDCNVLHELDTVLKPAVGFLVSKGWARSAIKRELEYSVHDIAEPIDYRQVDPWGYLRLRRGVLDLRELKLLDHVPYYFRSRLNVEISEEEIREIREGGYRVEDNEVYRLWRNHFEDEDWEYLVHSLGTWLAPYRFRHLAFLIGPSGLGKSTLVSNLTRPISPMVAWVSLRSLTSYTFGREALIGRQLVVHTERGEVVLRNLDVVNNIFGESDYVEVPRKFKPTIWIPCPKAGFFVMNDPPVLHEYGGETLKGFLDRLSIIFTRQEVPGFTPRKDVRVDPAEAFKFLLWCRVRLEQSGWEIRRRSSEDVLEYLMEASNTVLRFLKDTNYVEEDPSGRVKGTELYEAYLKWCNERGITPVGRSAFYATVATKYAKYEREKTVWFKGLRLRGE
jgi:energy-coupling factor transporter ATP-binding protein EcfA2